MAELTERLIKMGREIGYSGADLQMFIKKGRDKGKRKGRKRKGRERTRTRRKKTEKRSRE